MSTPTPMANPSTTPDARGRPALWQALVLVGVVQAAAVPLIVAGVDRGRGAYDAINFHEKVIRSFIAQWPRPEFDDYLSATTPGYHFVLAAVGRYVSDSRMVLALAGAGFTVALLGVLSVACTRAGGAWRAVACCLPVAASLYVVNSGAWILPDNAGWLGCLVLLLIALRPRVDARMVVGSGLALLLLVLVRQIHVWALSPVLAAAWLGSGRRPGTPNDRPESETFASLFANPTPRMARVALVVIAALPAVATLAYFCRLWGGLQPPTFRAWYVGFGNPAAPALILALVGAFSVPFAAYLGPPLRDLWRDHRGVLAATIAAGVVACVAPATSYDAAAGRYSGLWNIAAKFPAFTDRSTLIVGLGVLGAIALAAWARALSFRDRWIMLAALAGFAAAQSASFFAYQRYSEPWVLISLAVMACRIEPPPGAAARRGALAGPLILAACLALFSAAMIGREPTAPDEGYTPGHLPPSTAGGQAAAAPAEPYSDRGRTPRIASAGSDRWGCR